MSLNFEVMKNLSQQGVSWIVNAVPTFILAMVTLLIGLWLIKKIIRKLALILAARDVEPTLVSFGVNVASISLKIILGIAVIGMLGVTTTSFIAVLGAAGLAIGLALQGNLANFAGGALILFMKPFKIGHYIVAQGVEGTVVDINVFSTALDTLDNQRVYVPNGALVSNVLNNLSSNDIRRVDVSLTLESVVPSYKVKNLFTEILAAHPLTLKDPKAFVSIEEFSELGIHYTLRSWVKTEDYWDAYFSLHEKTKETLENIGVNPAAPMRIVKQFDLDDRVGIKVNTYKTGEEKSV